MKTSVFKSAITTKKQLIPLVVRSLFVHASLNRKINAVLLISLMLLSIVSIVSYGNATQLLHVQTTITTEIESQKLRAQLLTQLLDAETSVRGYTITGKENYLAPYTASVKNYPNTIRMLLALSEDLSTRAQLETINRLADQKFSEVMYTITLRKNQGFIAAQKEVNTNKGQLYMDQIRNSLSHLDAREEKILNSSIQKSASSVRMTQDTAIIGALIEVGIIFIAITLITSELNKELAFANIVEYSDEAIIGKSLDGIVTSWNKGAERMYGYTAEEMIGKSITRIAPDDRSNEMLTILQHLKQGDSVEQYETIRRKKNGSLITVSLSVSPIRDTTGKVISVSVIAQDITEKKIAEVKLHQEMEEKLRLVDALEKSNKDLTAFSYSVSHDLRAPLRAIDGFAQILKEDYASHMDEQGKKVIDTIRSSTKQMGDLIDGLLALSRLGRQEIKVTEIDMTSLARTVFEELKQANPKRSITFTCDSLPKVYADSILMRQVWTNLLSNALKFTRNTKDAHISISSSIKDGTIAYQVSDTGAGFDMKYVDKLFGVFQRLHSVQDFEGSGIGLSLVKRVIERQGGTVWAKGIVDKGATFSFSLPKQKNPVVDIHHKTT